jgi:hypothetical protein
MFRNPTTNHLADRRHATCQGQKNPLYFEPMSSLHQAKMLFLPAGTLLAGLLLRVAR